MANMTFNANLLPKTDLSFDLGASNQRWNFFGKINGFTISRDVPADAIFTDTTYVFDGTYDSSTNKAATVSTVTNAISALDGNLNSTTPGAGKTLTAFSQTDGKVSATFGNISITKSQISDFPTSMTPTSHTHGNLTNDGKITTTATIANGDKLVIVDSDTTAGSKITGSSITFDGSTTTKALTQKGTWETFNNYIHPTGDGNRHVPETGTSSDGKFLKAGAIAGSMSWQALVAADIPNLSWSKITSDKPTTLAGYGITDATIASGTITLGTNTITPMTNIGLVTGESTAANNGITKTVGTTTSVAITQADLQSAIFIISDTAPADTSVIWLKPVSE